MTVADVVAIPTPLVAVPKSTADGMQPAQGEPTVLDVWGVQRNFDAIGQAFSEAAQRAYLRGPFLIDPSGPNIGQLTISPTANTNPAGVAQISLVANDPDPGNGQSYDCIIAFHPERTHVEDATIKCHRHPSDGAPGHIQIHTKKADGTDLISRLEIGYMLDDSYVLISSAHLMFDNNAYMKPRNAGQFIRVKNGANTRDNFVFEDSGVLQIVGDGTVWAAGGATPATVARYVFIRDDGGTLRKVPTF